ncbi:hypothetical protein PFLUV_G00123350 [Perca fluviatilis]|uniref:Uncharacterized protein n=1 Tax=Perca fluviatilis TaxID=8168 RepID=A0A6A5F3C8_PERFL|nr:hypothetical protein PFLUV_G00123350 [Perca fluviatilis]
MHTHHERDCGSLCSQGAQQSECWLSQKRISCTKVSLQPYKMQLKPRPPRISLTDRKLCDSHQTFQQPGIVLICNSQ